MAPRTCTTRVAPRRGTRRAGCGSVWPCRSQAGRWRSTQPAQRRRAAVGGIVRLVVDAGGRAVGEQNVGRGQPAYELLRLPLGPLARAVAAVARRAAEARETEAAHLHAPQLELLGADRVEGAVRVVVPQHAQLRQLHGRQLLDPGGLEVAEQEDELGPVGRDQLRDRRVGRLVREGQHPHGPQPSPTCQHLAHGGLPDQAARAGAPLDRHAPEARPRPPRTSRLSPRPTCSPGRPSARPRPSAPSAACPRSPSSATASG